MVEGGVEVVDGNTEVVENIEVVVQDGFVMVEGRVAYGKVQSRAEEGIVVVR